MSELFVLFFYFFIKSIRNFIKSKLFALKVFFVIDIILYLCYYDFNREKIHLNNIVYILMLIGFLFGNEEYCIY